MCEYAVTFTHMYLGIQVFFDHYPFIHWGKPYQLNLELTNMAKLARQLLHICLCLSFRQQNCNLFPTMSAGTSMGTECLVAYSYACWTITIFTKSPPQPMKFNGILYIFSMNCELWLFAFWFRIFSIFNLMYENEKWIIFLHPRFFFSSVYPSPSHPIFFPLCLPPSFSYTPLSFSLPSLSLSLGLSLFHWLGFVEKCKINQ